MNWTEAQTALANGHHVRRDWDTSLVMRDGQIQWEISDDLARSYSKGRKVDKRYAPHETDVVADDWVVVK